MKQTKKIKTFKNVMKNMPLAQAWLTDNGLTIPVMGQKETAVSFASRIIPFTSFLLQLLGLKGETSGYLKYTEVGEKPITKKNTKSS